ncbi:DUF1615 domain-containing protein [Piscinibacter koreensis]|uniref:DUF1615 domain-containing protein n=1 Tax=Piscinibacter koreensis TaxID=2742824 RepID=A0A7Y6TV50_9BURK|nr:DUF1615 domain-containing protein [Schlegelella koreensis]NUZ04562.1 DUF1615 domain-containing protein [Schlegelella koreensis]
MPTSALRRAAAARAGRCAGVLALVGALLAGCATEPPRPAPRAMTAGEARELIDAALPANVSDRPGWVADIYAGFVAHDVAPGPESVCAVMAVIQQESGFRVNPVVPGLGGLTLREIERRADRIGVPALVVRTALRLPSGNGQSFLERIEAAKTEKELSDIFQDLIGAVPMGRRLFADWNPIRTRGPMQVNVEFAEALASSKPYPYPAPRGIAEELFTRRGSVYFGIAHLLAYDAPYDRLLYRFADYNAGQYASRNAAFQRAASSASGIPLVADGALLARDSSARGAGSTLLAVRSMAGRLGLGERDIEAALERGRRADFAETRLYRRVFELAEEAEGRPLPRAQVPRIQLEGAKISRPLTNEWFANSVNGHHRRCMDRLAAG